MIGGHVVPIRIVLVPFGMSALIPCGVEWCSQEMWLTSGEGNTRNNNHCCHEQYVKDTEETVPDSVLLLRTIGELAVKGFALVLRVLLLVRVLLWAVEALVHGGRQLRGQ